MKIFVSMKSISPIILGNVTPKDFTDLVASMNEENVTSLEFNNVLWVNKSEIVSIQLIENDQNV